MLAEGAALAQVALVCALSAWLLLREGKRRSAIVALAAPLVLGAFVAPQIPARLVWTTMLGVSFAQHMEASIVAFCMLAAALGALIRLPH
jgi:cell division protein FtsW (lipid II flippase)